MSDPERPQEPEQVQCDITGEWLPEDEVIVLHGYRVGARGKAILLERLRSGETLPGELERPTVWARFGALLLDGILLFFIALGLGSIMGLFRVGQNPVADLDQFKVSAAINDLMVALIGFLYYALLHAFRGQSIGKMAARIKVVVMDGKDLSGGRSFLRAFFYPGVHNLATVLAALAILTGIMEFFSGEVLFFSSTLFGVITMAYLVADIVFALVDTTMQRSLHDRLSGTRVVRV